MPETPPGWDGLIRHLLLGSIALCCLVLIGAAVYLLLGREAY